MPEIKIIAKNRKAYHDYHVLDSYEAGLVLTGTEVKSIRAGKINLSDGWVDITLSGEAYLDQVHISPYSHGNMQNHPEKRRRKLLLNKRELIKLANATANKGHSIIPLKVYFKGQRIKVEIALAKGKKAYDKRDAARERDDNRDIQRALRARHEDL